MEDPVKVQAKIDELKQITGHNWFALSGNHALTKVNIKGNGDEYEFVPSSGMPLKVFVDIVTGETKSFVSVVFEVDK